jgi:hypothetical protein
MILATIDAAETTTFNESAWCKQQMLGFGVRKYFLIIFL